MVSNSTTPATTWIQKCLFLALKLGATTCLEDSWQIMVTARQQSPFTEHLLYTRCWSQCSTHLDSWQLGKYLLWSLFECWGFWGLREDKKLCHNHKLVNGEFRIHSSAVWVQCPCSSPMSMLPNWEHSGEGLAFRSTYLSKAKVSLLGPLGTLSCFYVLF